MIGQKFFLPPQKNNKLVIHCFLNGAEGTHNTFPFLDNLDSCSYKNQDFSSCLDNPFFVLLVKIVDVVPSIAEVRKEFAEGTLKPSSILKHSSKGTILKWDIPELAPGEERLISYDIKSKLSIIGSFSLPRAKIKFICNFSDQVGLLTCQSGLAKELV